MNVFSYLGCDFFLIWAPKVKFSLKITPRHLITDFLLIIVSLMLKSSKRSGMSSLFDDL